MSHSSIPTVAPWPYYAGPICWSYYHSLPCTAPPSSPKPLLSYPWYSCGYSHFFTVFDGKLGPKLDHQTHKGNCTLPLCNLLSKPPRPICWMNYHNGNCLIGEYGDSPDVTHCGYSHDHECSTGKLSPEPLCSWHRDCTLPLCNPPPKPATCFFAYHGYGCGGDPDDPNHDPGDEVCPFSHEEVEEGEIVAVAYEEGYEHRSVGEWCYLEYCPLALEEEQARKRDEEVAAVLVAGY